MSNPGKTTVRMAALGAVASVLLLGSPAFAQDGDAAKGEKVFRKCASCHNVGEGAKNKVGPALTGVFGRTAGTFEGFRYGDAIIAAGEAGLVWNEEEMFEYLLDPRAYLRETLGDDSAKSKMAFKLKKEDERRDVIAYVKTFSDPVDEADADAEADTETETETESDSSS